VVKAAYEIARPSIIEAGIDYQTELGPDVPFIRGNHNQLTQVVLNLLNNAVQALGSCENPQIRVRLRFRAGEAMKESVELVIEDNGPGVDSEVLPRLFEPFTTTKDTGDRTRKAGMGLGLAIVKRIVEIHHGVVRVETKPGRGTSFHVVLPREGAEG